MARQPTNNEKNDALLKRIDNFEIELYQVNQENKNLSTNVVDLQKRLKKYGNPKNRKKHTSFPQSYVLCT